MSVNQLPKPVPTMRDIFLHEKNKVNDIFIGKYITIYEADEIFKQGVACGGLFAVASLSQKTSGVNA